MLLFLDFDGVLHPRSTIEYRLVHIPRFKGVLRDFPHVQVVQRHDSLWVQLYGFSLTTPKPASLSQEQP